MATRPLKPDIPDMPDEELVSAQAHLAESRAALARMRAHTLSLRAQGGNAVSTEQLQYVLANRAAALTDDGRTPLFFGRLDYAEPVRERFHIGRRHVHDDVGDPMVIDWRAEVARAFYRASASNPMGLELRRRFGYDQGRLTAYEDERFGAGQASTGPSALLVEEIERPRSGPMRDIVATIQPEQDEIVRAPVEQTVCVQGAPGTGKTAVGLHRAAYLLYAYRERLARSGVLVIGPNRSFLSYIGQVLPALGELEATQLTVDEMVAHVPVRGEDQPAVARLKGDPRLAEVLHRAVWSHLSAPTEPLLVVRGSRRYRVPSSELAGLVDELRDRQVRYGSGRQLLAQRIAHRVLVRMEADGDSPDDRVQNAVARSRPVRACVDALWPAVDPVRLVYTLLSDAEALAGWSHGLLDEAEQELLRWPRPPRSANATRWSAADAVLVDEAHDLLERTPSVGHVVLDEAQDLSPMQCRAVGRRCSTGSATVLGDIAQGTTAWATESWARTLEHLGKPEASVEELLLGFRVPAEIIRYACRLLPHIAPGLAPAGSVRHAPGALTIERVSDLTAGAVHAAEQALKRDGGLGTVGLICPDAAAEDLVAAVREAGLDAHRLGGDQEPEPAGHRLTVVPVGVAKGLEYDHVVVVEPARIVAAEDSGRHGLRRLYVALTRAVSSLTVVHAAELPGELAD